MKKLLIGALLLGAGALQAQTIEPTYIFYNQHLNLVNPAAVGTEKGHTISADIRSQWSGSDAPTTQSFFTTNRITDRVGLGLSVVTDKVFVQRQSAVFADFSYRVPIDEKSNLIGGIKFGGDFFNIDIDNIRTFNHLYNTGQNNTQYDPYLQNIAGKFQFNFGAGVYYEHPDFYVGISVPNMLASNKTQVNNDVVTSVSERMLFYGNAGYYWRATPDITVKPSAQVRLAKGEDTTAKFTAAADYISRAELGLTYSTNKAFSVYALFNIPKYYLSVGYGFETYMQSNLYLSRKSSHEFLVRVKF